MSAQAIVPLRDLTQALAVVLRWDLPEVATP